MKINEIIPVFVNRMPDELEDGKIYIFDFPHYIAIHLCACGCKKETVTPLGEKDWLLTQEKGKITLRPSIGNFKGENPYHAHYFITENKVEWC